MTFIQTKLDHDKGRWEYEVEFYTAGYQEYDYEIDALTGEILEFDYDAEHWSPPQQNTNASRAQSCPRPSPGCPRSRRKGWRSASARPSSRFSPSALTRAGGSTRWNFILPAIRSMTMRLTP